MKQPLIAFEYFDDPEKYLELTWNNFVEVDKTLLDPKKLWYAYNAKKYLDDLNIDEIEDAFDKIYFKGRCYYCVAIIYLYNDWFEEAFELEQCFIGMKYFEVYRKNINAYLSSLIVKNKSGQLEKLFSDAALKERYMEYYEVYISMLVNPNYHVTLKWNILVPIINEINNTKRLYEIIE
jgi:hypothetical protein